VALAEQAVVLFGRGTPAVLDTLAAAYAETGQFPKAVAAARGADIPPSSNPKSSTIGNPAINVDNTADPQGL